VKVLAIALSPTVGAVVLPATPFEVNAQIGPLKSPLDLANLFAIL
jgi:hypothetical protein